MKSSWHGKKKTCLLNSLFVSGSSWHAVKTEWKAFLTSCVDKRQHMTLKTEASTPVPASQELLLSAEWQIAPPKKVPQAKESANSSRSSYFSAAQLLITFPFAFEKVVAPLSSLLQDISLLQIYSVFEILNSLNDSYLLQLQSPKQSAQSQEVDSGRRQEKNNRNFSGGDLPPPNDFKSAAPCQIRTSVI